MNETKTPQSVRWTCRANHPDNSSGQVQVHIQLRFEPEYGLRLCFSYKKFVLEGREASRETLDQLPGIGRMKRFLK